MLDELPERLLVGTGASGRMRPDPRALETLRARGVEVEVVPTADAVQRYPARPADDRGRPASDVFTLAMSRAEVEHLGVAS